MTDWKPNIFTYLDYRSFLHDYYLRAKTNTRAMSYRYLSRRAGFKSPNFVKLVMDGDRNLSDDGALRVARAFDLCGEEKTFFCHLVTFNQATTPEDKNAAFSRISASKRFRQARKVDQEFFEYLSHWYHTAIQELVIRPDFQDDPAWIANQLSPPITTQEAAQALEVLMGLDLLRKSEDGTYERATPTLSTGHEVRSLAVGNYHRQMIKLGSESIARADASTRHLSAVTMSVDEPTFLEIKERIQAFTEEIMELVDHSAGNEHVYQLNLQLFPMTKIDPKK